MEQKIDEKVKLFVENRNIMQSSFWLESSIIFPLSALIYASRGLKIDPQKIKDCKKIIKNNSGAFSNFRGVGILSLATLLSLEESGEEMFSKVQKVYAMLKKDFRSSPFLPFTAFLIAKDVEEDAYEKVVSKAKDMYDLMKSNHPFLTSGEDTSFAALFAMSPEPNEEFAKDMEECYEILKQFFSIGNALQTLSHVLAISEEKPQDKCNLTMDLYNRMRDYNIKFGRGYELPILGVLALNISDSDRTIRDIDQIQEYLKNQKGFGIFGIGKKQRIMYAAILASQIRSEKDESVLNTATVNTVTSMVIAQQAAMIAIIASSSVAAAAGSSR